MLLFRSLSFLRAIYPRLLRGGDTIDSYLTAGRPLPLSCPPTPTPTPAPQVLGEDDRSVRAVADEFGAYLRPSSYGQDVKPLLKEMCRRGAIFSLFSPFLLV